MGVNRYDKLNLFEVARAVFIWTSVAILTVAGVGKLLSVLGETRILAEKDPLFWFLSNRQVLFIAGVGELSVAGGIIFSRRLKAEEALWIVVTLATCFVVYRLGLWAIEYEAPCRCLGAFTDAIGVDARTADWIMKGILVYLFLGGFTLVWMTRATNLGESH